MAYLSTVYLHIVQVVMSSFAARPADLYDSLFVGYTSTAMNTSVLLWWYIQRQQCRQQQQQKAPSTSQTISRFYLLQFTLNRVAVRCIFGERTRANLNTHSVIVVFFAVWIIQYRRRVSKCIVVVVAVQSLFVAKGKYVIQFCDACEEHIASHCCIVCA